ncbi:MAG: FAD-dependent oxidoreductase [Solirubrobacterales bacterium]|nr:FAD-dependent oxidoreductase [Solirubrobacterales bacterium]
MIVIGGGAVGLCLAESLTSRGAEVTVFERGRCGSAASAGNAGWITPSLSLPVPGPGVIGEALRWLVNPSGPLWIRPTLAPPMIDWLTRFIFSCSASAFARGLAVLQRAGARAGPAYDRLATRGVQFELHEDPLLYPAFDRRELEHLWKVVGDLRRAGSRQPLERLSREEILGIEPSLGGSVIGGVIARDERRVRPELLSLGIRDALVSRGVEVLEHSPVVSLVRDRGGWRAVGGAEDRSGDAVVIAGGAESRRLLAALGVRLPIVGAKGYSRTYPSHPSGPKHPLYLEGPKVAISVFDGGLRVSGTLELGARGLALSPRRLEAITTAAQRALPRWRPASPPSDWAGMRSLSPDGLPFVGALPGVDGIHLATAHATLGITLAPLTGELLATQLLERKPDELLAAFDPARALRPYGPRRWIARTSRPCADLSRQQQQEDSR